MKQIWLILVLLGMISACAPAVEQPVAASVPSETSLPPVEADSQPIVEAATMTAVPDPTATQPEIQALSTSRGDALVATDPALVNLKTGRPVVVEFFRFT